MAIEDFAVGRLDALVEKAEALLATYKRPPDNFIGFEGWVDAALFAEWRSQSLVLLRQVLGNSHTYASEFADRTEKESVPSSVKKGAGLLRAVREDISNGYLRNTRELVAAEIFSDFLEMASHLHGAGYAPAAASLAGAVLEDGLRRAAAASDITVKRSDGLESLSKKLAESGKLSALGSRRIDAWRTIRNSADHGHFSEFTPDDVREMINGVAELLERLRD